ncbi:Endonuclease III-like protein 1 [Phytophthora pseudosyringae]|uniref:Endonuclease III homolog n=1 Tax=Phytophthora pseudosyringae TaxID=221518 RepID=A0A8T1VFU7_9STRA|nr:Endonuclease III-like protein 1 [Phytophthora pseudosyringae]
MGTSETSGGNPFTRFAFASARTQDSSAHADVKLEDTAQQLASSSAKRARSDKKKKKKSASPSRPTKLIKTEPSSETKQRIDIFQDVETDKRLELLLALFEARTSMTTPIDKFGTQVCVAPGVTSAKVERFQLLVAALLSSQTQDPITYAAMQRLHQLGENDEGLTIGTVQATSEGALSEALKPVGFYHRKAQHLKRVATVLSSQFHGDIPRSLDELLALPGIGPKIGRVIMLLAWGQVDGIVVDTHVHRLAQRLGWASTTTPEDTRKQLEDWIPREHWGKLSLAVVGFGQTVCTAKTPSCSTCPLAPTCPSAFKVDTSHESKKRRTSEHKNKNKKTGT